ncbi:hypothetical protein TNCV_1983831 [Trichonephila clavipes]|nr:hypothetical protein TNCV_1983831 [Trichonephila clavipes]
MRVSRNEREVTSGKQKIELAKLQLAKLKKEVEFQRAKNKALSLNPAAKVEEKQFKTLNKETATHIGIREAEDWFRPIDLAKECDIYISSKNGSHKEIPITYGYTQDPFKNRSQNFKPKIKENYPQYLEKKIKIALYAVIHLIAQETPWQWKRRKREIVLNRRPELYRGKYRCVQPKIQLVEKDVLMPVKHNVFLWNLPDVEEVPSHDGETILLWSPWKYRCGQRTVRMAVMACSQKQAVFARRRSKSKPKRKLLDIRAELERGRTREVREQALPSEYHRQTYL